MARGVYTVEFTNKTATAAMADFDFFEFDPATEKPIELMGFVIGQETAEGDANTDYIRYAVLRFSGGTFTSGGEVSTTPRACDPSDGAASFAADAFNANGGAASSSGTTVRLQSDTFNLATGIPMWYPEEYRFKVDGTAQSAMVIRCESTLDASVAISGTAWVKEV